MVESRCGGFIDQMSYPDYLERGGDINIAKRMAGHSNVKTTELYDRRADEVSFSEMSAWGLRMREKRKDDLPRLGSFWPMVVQPPLLLPVCRPIPRRLEERRKPDVYQQEGIG